MTSLFLKLKQFFYSLIVFSLAHRWLSMKSKAVLLLSHPDTSMLDSAAKSITKNCYTKASRVLVVVTNGRLLDVRGVSLSVIEDAEAMLANPQSGLFVARTESPLEQKKIIATFAACSSESDNFHVLVVDYSDYYNHEDISEWQQQDGGRWALLSPLAESPKPGALCVTFTRESLLPSSSL